MRLYMKSKRQNRNAGFSLVELLVTLAIMAVLIAGSAVSYSLINRTNVKKSAEIVDDYLTLCKEKAKTSSAYEWNVTIDATGDKNIRVELVKVTKQEDGYLYEEIVQSESLPAKIVIRVDDKYGSPNYVSGETGDRKYVSIAFGALSGNVSKVYFDKNDTIGMDVSGGYCDIVSDYKDKKQKTIRLYFTTGKHSIID